MEPFFKVFRFSDEWKLRLALLSKNVAILWALTDSHYFYINYFEQHGLALPEVLETVLYYNIVSKTQVVHQANGKTTDKTTLKSLLSLLAFRAMITLSIEDVTVLLSELVLIHCRSDNYICGSTVECFLDI